MIKTHKKMDPSYLHWTGAWLHFEKLDKLSCDLKYDAQDFICGAFESFLEQSCFSSHLFWLYSKTTAWKFCKTSPFEFHRRNVRHDDFYFWLNIPFNVRTSSVLLYKWTSLTTQGTKPKHLVFVLRPTSIEQLNLPSSHFLDTIIISDNILENVQHLNGQHQIRRYQWTFRGFIARKHASSEWMKLFSEAKTLKCSVSLDWPREWNKLIRDFRQTQFNYPSRQSLEDTSPPPPNTEHRPKRRRDAVRTNERKSVWRNHFSLINPYRPCRKWCAHFKEKPLTPDAPQEVMSPGRHYRHTAKSAFLT